MDDPFCCSCCCFTISNRRAREYGQYLDIQEVWVVHFTLKKEGTDFRYPFPDLALGVNVLHVWHNFEFSEVIIKTAKMEETIQIPTVVR